MADENGGQVTAAGAAPIPLLENKDFAATSVFQPENLLREARRQLGLPEVNAPRVCLLDPDGDIVRHLQATGTGVRHPGWACYHTKMWVTDLHGLEVGVVGLAVGAPFAVLVAEQLSASGAELILSVTSAGQIRSLGEPPYFVLITKARRDEGTSHHYRPVSEWSTLGPDLEARLLPALRDVSEPVLAGTSWTTDAPYRETQLAVDAADAAGIHCVEMEAAALYAYGAARRRKVVCFAHITNSMAVNGNDFEKGSANGALTALEIAEVAARSLLSGLS
ncbi:MAG TPA: nucleoside phosphorylase [Acidimicrobiales bacterium]|nr:nucleoside phosphorylase [Acidimicrobiales bacterium]